MERKPLPPLELFYCYAHKDRALRDELDIHLASLRRSGLITGWHDGDISPGVEQNQEVDFRLSTAHLILILVSPDFLDTDSCDVQMKRAMERLSAGETRVIPIILRPTAWEGIPLYNLKLQALPRNGRPITSWRKRDEALQDIAEDIRKVIGELRASTHFFSHSQTMPHTQRKQQLWTVPYRRNPLFTGQETLLTSLHEKLKRDQTIALTQPHALSGLGGIGKTAIAVQYAYRYRDDYQAIIWLNADSQESLLRDFITLAGSLQLPVDTKKPEEIIQSVKYWLETHDEWLLIFDNADDLQLLDDFFPSFDTGPILLTTRSTILGTLAEGIQVQQMGLEEGMLFLLRRAKILKPNDLLEYASPEDREAAQTLVEELGGLPLALDQAGAYIDECGRTLSYYLALYRTHTTRARLLRSRGMMSNRYPQSVFTTWALNFEKVEQEDVATADLLRLCAFFHPDAIPEEFFTTEGLHDDTSLQVFADLSVLDVAIKALRRYSFIHCDATSKTFSIHRLIQVVQKERMDEGQQKKWINHAIRVVSALLPDPLITRITRYERYFLHAQTCAAHIEQSSMISKEAADCLQIISDFLRAYGQYKQERVFRKQLSALYERAQDRRNTKEEFIQSLLDGAQTHQDLGEYDQADSNYQQVLALYEKEQYPALLPLAETLHRWAILYQEQDRFEQASPLYQRALFLYEYVLGPDFLYETYSSNDIAFHASALGFYEHLLPPDHVAPALHERLESLDLADYFYKLANLYVDLDLYEPATSLYQRSLVLYERAAGRLDHPDLTDILTRLAYTYHLRGNDKRSDALFEQVRSIQERNESNPVGRADSFYNWALKDYGQGKYRQALFYGNQALTLYEQMLGTQHPIIADTCSLLADCYQDLEDDEQAILFYQCALDVYKQALAPSHLRLVKTIGTLIEIYQKQCQYEQTIPLYEYLLTLGGRDATTFASRGQTYRLMQRYSEALIDLDNAITLGDTSAWTFTERGITYRLMGRYQEALTDLNEALSLDEKDRGALAGRLAERGITYRLMDRYQEALTDLNEAIANYTQVFTLDPNNTAAYYGRGAAYSQLQRHEQALADFNRYIQLKPKDAFAYLDRGYAHLYLREREQALADFVCNVKMEPTNVNAAWMTIYASLGKQRPGAEIAERLEAIAAIDIRQYEAITCQGIALGLRDKFQEGLIKLEQSLQISAQNVQDTSFWKGMFYAYMDRSMEAQKAIEQALKADLPPILLTPLYWLEKDRPTFFREHAEPLLTYYGV